MSSRASSGYGDKFAVAGFKRWGLEMQDDLADGVQYAIEQSIADRDRICIVGGSYGGYAALMGISRAEDRIKAFQELERFLSTHLDGDSTALQPQKAH